MREDVVHHTAWHARAEMPGRGFAWLDTGTFVGADQQPDRGQYLEVDLGLSATTNRITDTGFAYDAAGNLTNDGLHTYTYNAENQITSLDGTAASYAYDPGGHRYWKTTGSNNTLYIFAGSKVIAEYVNGSLTKEYIYSGSQVLATIAGGGITYSHGDHLSVRVQRDAAGDAVRTFGHLPFGDLWYETGMPDKWKFTSYERDSESQLDYAIFRYNSWRLGRFMSPDPVAGNITNPQSLNRYSYVNNDPLNLIDPVGLDEVVIVNGIGTTI